VDFIALHLTLGEAMIDAQSLNELTQQQIKASVDQQVQILMANEDWINNIEQSIVESIKTRIIAKFSNISTVPDLVDTVKTSVVTLFDQGAVPDLKNYINQDKITQAVDRAVESLIDSAIINLTVDPAWLTKIENQIDQNMAERLSRLLKSIDLNSLLITHIDQGINRWQDRLKKDFATNGITDNATTTQLTIQDNAVVAENDLVANKLYVNRAAVISGDLVVDNLIVKKLINTDNTSWDELSNKISSDVLASITEQWQQGLVEEVLESAKTKGIDFDYVMLNGAPLVKDGTLNPDIVSSNIQSLGALKDLTVTGSVKLNNTLNVNTKRIGINTESPEMALSVWDEEVSVIAGKLANQTAYIGTARSQSLAIGINRIPQITIDPTGLTIVKQLQVDRFKLGFAPAVPGYSGTRGDFVFNSDPQPGGPFGWVCLGSFQWQPLKGA